MAHKWTKAQRAAASEAAKARHAARRKAANGNGGQAASSPLAVVEHKLHDPRQTEVVQVTINVPLSMVASLLRQGFGG